MEIGVIELFGGIGACSQALKRLGFKERIIDYVEIDKFAVKSFNAINDTNYEPQDITKWDKKYYCYNCGNCFKSGKFYEEDDEIYDNVCPNCGCCPVEELTTCVDLIMHGSPCFRAGELVNTIGGDDANRKNYCWGYC